jgi:hypothetical protein
MKLPFLVALSAAAGCTGLVAGPESSAVNPVSASRDSAYVRARRATQAEAFTVDLADSAGGRIAGTRYPGSKAPLGSAEACRVRLALQIEGNGQGTQVATTSRWIAPQQMQSKAPDVCERERSDVLARIAQTIEPPSQ